MALVVLFALSMLPFSSGEGKYHALEIVIALLALGLGLAAPSRSFARPLGLFFLWAAASLAWCPSRGAGVDTLLWLAAALIVAGIACQYGHRAITAASDALLLVAAPTLAFGLVQYATGRYTAHWGNPIRLAGPFVNSNLYAAFVMIALLLAGARAAQSSTPRLARAATALLALVAAASLILTVSRGGWLASGVGIATLFAAGVPKPGVPKPGVPKPGVPKTRRPRVAAALSVGLLVLISAAASLGWLTRVSERLRGAGTYSLGHRASIYAATLEMIRRHPIGVGAGGFRSAFPAVRVHSDRFEVRFAHSDALQLVAVFGIPGVALLALAVARSRESQDDTLSVLSRAPARGVTAAIVGLAVQSCFDFPVRKPVIALWLASVLGAALGGREGRPLLKRSSTLGFATILAVLGAVLLRGELLRLDAERLEESQALTAAAHAYQRADRWLPFGDPGVARAAGAVNARMAAAPRLGALFLPRAITAYETALARAPNDAHATLSRGILAFAGGDPRAGNEWVRRAAALAPRDGYTLVTAARALSDHDDLVGALAQLSRALDTTPYRATPDELVDAFERARVPPESLLSMLNSPSRRGAELLLPALGERGHAGVARLLAARLEPRWERP